MKLIEREKMKAVIFENNVCVVNTTPHPITMMDAVTEELVTVPCSGVLINGTPETVPVGNLFVKTVFRGNEEGREMVKKIEEAFHGEHTLVIVGSIIAAQAFPGKVAGLVPVPGFERVAPAEKRMRTDRFTIF